MCQHLWLVIRSWQTWGRVRGSWLLSWQIFALCLLQLLGRIPWITSTEVPWSKQSVEGAAILLVITNCWTTFFFLTCPFFAEGLQLLFRNLALWFKTDPGTQFFTKPLIRYSNYLYSHHSLDKLICFLCDKCLFSVYLCFFNVWMGVEELFDFSRVNIFSSTNDHVLDPPNNFAVTVLVYYSNIPVCNARVVKFVVSALLKGK